jgi:hypothetical protein
MQNANSRKGVNDEKASFTYNDRDRRGWLFYCQLSNIKEVIEMCLEEQELEPVNKFVGFRELEIIQNA